MIEDGRSDDYVYIVEVFLKMLRGGRQKKLVGEGRAFLVHLHPQNWSK
jgi:hypothetical protein